MGEEMKTVNKTMGIVVYTILLILCLITLVTGFGGVSENLDGWHGFTKKDTSLFVIINVLMMGGCLMILKSLVIGKMNGLVIKTGGIALVVLPIIFHMVPSGLQGNVDTDFQYLVLRTFQGFDHTYIYITFVAAIGLIVLMTGRSQADCR